MSLPFNLNSVLETASLVEGFDVVRNAFPVEGRFTKRVITYSDAVYEALNDVAEDFSDWPEDQGFGFAPYLKVVEYSEAEYHEMMLRREQGI